MGKKLILSVSILLLLSACSVEKPKAQCEMKDLKKISLFADDKDVVNKITIEEYQIAVDLKAYEETKDVRQESLDKINEVKGISATESLKGKRSTKTYTIDFKQLDTNINDLLGNEYNFGSDLSLSTLVKNYESMGFVCK